MLDLAVPAGANYVDVLFNDPTDAHSDYWDAIGPAIRRHREDLVLAVHWGFSDHQPVDQCLRCFDEALDRLGNDYADVAMLTMVDIKSTWTGWAREGIERIRGYQRDGRVGFIGLSGHDPAVARMAVESGSIDVLMFPLNIYQHDPDPEREALLRCCAEHQVGVVVMKVYHGGRLLTTEGRPTGITPAQCLHYVLSHSVATTVPGVRNADQMRQALNYLEASVEEKQATPLHDELVHRLSGQCVECQHCLPCPQDIPIPSVITCLDYIEYYGLSEFHQVSDREWYATFPAKGSDCTECEVCIERCPFDVDIIGKMQRAVEVFE